MSCPRGEGRTHKAILPCGCPQEAFILSASHTCGETHSIFTSTRGSGSYPILRVRKLRLERYKRLQWKIMEQTGGKQQVLPPQNHCRQAPPSGSPRPSPAQPCSPCCSGGAGTGLSLNWDRGRCCYSQETQPKSQMLSMCLEHF